MRKCIVINQYEIAFELKENSEYTYKQAYNEIKDFICSAYFIDKVMDVTNISKEFSFSGIHFNNGHIKISFEDVNGSEIIAFFPLMYSYLFIMGLSSIQFVLHSFQSHVLSCIAVW